MQVVAVLQANVRSFVAQQGEILSDRNKWKALMKLVHGLQTQLCCWDSAGFNARGTSQEIEIYFPFIYFKSVLEKAEK